MANLSKDIQCAGSDTRPPMVDRIDFASWKQHIRLYYQGKENEVNILKSIDEGPFQIGIVWEPLADGTEGAPHLGPERPRVYSDLSLEEKDRFVTAVKLNRGLGDSNYDQLYAYLKKHETHANENKMMLDQFSQHTVDPLALMSNVSHQQHYSQSSSTLPSTYDAFNSDVDEALMAQTMFMANLSSAGHVNDEAGPLYDLEILSEVHDHDHYQDTVCAHHEEHMMHHNVQLNHIVDSHSDYTIDSNMIPYDLPKPYYDELNKVAIGYKNPLCLTRAKQIQPALYNGHEIIKDNHVPAIVRNTEDTLEIAKITRKKINDKMKDPECVTHKLRLPNAALIENLMRLNEKILIANDNLVAEWLSKEVLSVTTNSELNVARFTKMHVAHTIVEIHCLELEAGLSNLRDKSHNECHDELVKRFSNLEVHHLNMPLKYQNLKDSFGNNPPTPDKDTPDFDSFFVIGKMQASLQGKDNVIKKLQKQISHSKDPVKPKVLAPGKYDIDVEPIVARLRNNRETHLDYLRHLKESVETIYDIVEKAKVNMRLALVRKTLTNEIKNNTQKTNVPVPPSTGVNHCTHASRSHTKSNIKKNRISPAKGVNKLQVEEQPKTNKSPLRTSNRVNSSSRPKRTVVQIFLWYLDSGYSKHMTGDRSWLMNFVKKFIETFRFRNDHFGAIMGYGDYMIGDSVISRVYYVEGLGHNLFFVRQFCGADLEVAFRKHSCYVRDTDGVELIKGSCGSNFYTILVEDMMKSSPICLLSKASKNKSWLSHRRLNHLNFGKGIESTTKEPDGLWKPFMFNSMS
nr:integrase, catalytic region, zinc finger, CCHC-type, peptidase aspartic, catalytic [Tanacetum cinerariifolium]